MSEVEVVWRVSSQSAGGNCVEVAAVSRRVAVRDSKNPGSAQLRFTPAGWQRFLSATKRVEEIPDV